MGLKRMVVALSAAALALAACTGSNSNTTPSTSSSNTSDSQGEQAPIGLNAAAKPPAPPIPGAKKGGTLTVLSASGLDTMDPTEAYYVMGMSILSGLVTRSLTQYVYDPDAKEMVLVPDLATDLGRPSLDFKTWEFTLRPGVKFENGRPVTAADLEYGIERSFDRTTFEFGAGYSNQYFLHGDAYEGPYRSPGPYNGVTVNGNTITIHMRQPFLDMSYYGSFPAMGPIPPGDASDPATYKNHPWATGPYMFKPGGYVPGKSLVLVKNPYWDPDTDPGRHQYVDEFDMKFATDSAEIDQVILADTGPGQTTMSYDTVLAADYKEFNATASDRLIRGTFPCTYMWYPDNRTITDIRVRRALAYAYPYRAVWAAQGQIPGVTRIPASNVLPPGFPGRVVFNPLPGHTPGTTDSAKAKASLKAAGQLGYPIKFPYATDIPTGVAVKNVVVKALTAAGFDPQPVETTETKYFPRILKNPQAPVDIRYLGWCSDWPSGSSWFPEIFHSTDIASVGFGSNYAAFSSKLVDDRIEAIPQLLLSEQAPAWNALDKLIQTRYFPVVVTGYGGVAMMRGSKVHNVLDDTTFGMPTWKDIWLG
jgi:peptide/nickel transport system substrate-binding protein